MRKNFYNEITDNSVTSVNGYQAFNAELNYTFQQGDGQKLKKNGILRVYNINQPIEIPVTRLLGKWKESYVGVTVGVRGGEWVIEKQIGVIEMEKDNRLSAVKVGIAKQKKGIFKYKLPGIVRRIFSKETNDGNFLPNM